MTYFSYLLSAYAKRIGINSPQIASYCGLDRVTVYRFMKGKPLPKERDIVRSRDCTLKRLQKEIHSARRGSLYD